jgi:cytochrome b
MAYCLARTPAGRVIVLSALLAVVSLPGITDSLSWESATYADRQTAQDEADEQNRLHLTTHTTI